MVTSGDVAATDVTYKLTEMKTAKFYIIKEIRYVMDGTPLYDALIA